MRRPPLLLVGNAAEAFRGPLRAGLHVFAGLHSERAFVSSRVGRLPRAPEPWDGAFRDWLEETATRLPGAVLMPNTDNMAWWLARNAHDLPRGFGPVAAGPFDAVRTAQVKSRLAEACAGVGLSTPKTLLLDSEDPVREAGELVGFPLVLKPQMRTGIHHWTRGRVIRSAAELGPAWERYLAEVRFEPEVLVDAPEARFPLAQRYIRRPGHTVLHIAGYLSREGDAAAASHRKLLQVPLRFGSGVCFESVPRDEELAAKLLGLLRAMGYHGIFEAEFLPEGGEHLLVDLNLRPYNGIALELAAGLDAVTLSYLDALGEQDDMRAAIQRFNEQPFAPLAWCHHSQLVALSAGQLISGRLGPRQVLRHARWAWKNRMQMVDPFFSREDPLLGVREAAALALTPFKAPRQFLGTYVRQGLDR